MTRMKLFYIDKDGTCYRTVEFNGDGYCTNPDDNGWIGLQHLIKCKFDTNNMEKSFKDMMCVFNRETYDYPERKITLIDGIHKFIDNGVSYYIMHEPSNDSDINDYTLNYPNEIGLYGHIHGRAFAKTNGFDLAIDYHNYTPISFDKVKWFANAIQYWDNNVIENKIHINQSLIKE